MVLLVVMGVTVLVRLSGVAERWAFYFPDRGTFVTPPGYQDVWFETPDGKRLHGWLMRPAGAATVAPTVLFAHGNAGSMPDHAPFCEFLVEAGFTVFMFDYRGYGRSDRGWISRDGLAIDTKAAIDHLVSLDGVDPDRIAVFGFSLGGVMAFDAAAAHANVRAVVSTAAFSSWSQVARDHAGLLGSLLVRSGRDASDAAARLDGTPMLIVHGSDDEIVAVGHAHEIERAALTAQLFVVEGAGHNDVLVDYPDARSRIIAFLREAMHTD